VLPEAHLSHSSTGRLRIRIPAKKGDSGYFSSLKERFGQFPGIRRIDVNPVTGSVLVFHSIDLKAIDPRVLAEYAEVGGLFKIDLAPRRGPSAPEIISETYHNANGKVKQFTDGGIDLPTLAFAGLVGTGLFQIGTGNLGGPMWHAAFWYGLNIFLQGQRGQGTETPPK